MEILTERLKISELSVSDVSDISKIAQDIAWNDTLNLLIREDIDEATFIHYNKSALYSYKQKLYDSVFLDGVSELYKKVPQSFIPEENWHINFSLLPPPFEENALKFIDGAMKRKNGYPRQGFWMGIRGLETNELIGGISISTRVLPDDEGKNKIGHAGMFLHPDHQRKGIVSEANAVMIDFMYKYLFDELGNKISENTYFYTMCHPLNIGSQKIQEKAGGILNTQRVATKGKFEFYATRQQQEESKLFEKEIPWRAVLDTGEIISSITGKESPLVKVESPPQTPPTNGGVYRHFIKGRL